MVSISARWKDVKCGVSHIAIRALRRTENCPPSDPWVARLGIAKQHTIANSRETKAGSGLTTEVGNYAKTTLGDAHSWYNLSHQHSLSQTRRRTLSDNRMRRLSGQAVTRKLVSWRDLWGLTRCGDAEHLPDSMLSLPASIDTRAQSLHLLSELNRHEL